MTAAALAAFSLSTPHGALGTIQVKVCSYLNEILLSTPHGALGTQLR